MLDINILKNSWYFKEVVLEKSQVLFSEWQVDNNIYIVLAWELSVEKYTTKQKNETKILAYLKQNDVFWEAALSNNEAKQVSIVAKRKTLLLSIDAEKWIYDFSKKYPKEAFELLKYIIFLSNKRLLDANYLITANYKISNEIIALEEINIKKIFELIEKLKESIDVSEIIYYETNPVMDNYITLRYDTRQKTKMQNKVIEITNSKLDLLDLKVDGFSTFTQRLSIWHNNLGYLVFLKKSDNFNELDKKILTSTATSIAWLIKQKQLLDEERDKQFMNE